MAVRTKEELMNMINERIGEDDSDETLEFLEDVTDTLNDFESKSTGDSEDWKAKYEENDASWRKKYRDRFFNNSVEEIEENEEVETEKEPKTFEDLFKKE